MTYNDLWSSETGHCCSPKSRFLFSHSRPPLQEASFIKLLMAKQRRHVSRIGDGGNWTHAVQVRMWLDPVFALTTRLRGQSKLESFKLNHIVRSCLVPFMMKSYGLFTKMYSEILIMTPLLSKVAPIGRISFNALDVEPFDRGHPCFTLLFSNLHLPVSLVFGDILTCPDQVCGILC